MDNKILNTVLPLNQTVGSLDNETEIKNNKIDENSTGINKTTETPQKHYEAISKNGDTLELRSDGKKLGKQLSSSISFQFVTKSNTKKMMSDATLLGYSESKLRQLYNNKEISPQKYNSILKKKTQSN